MLVNKLTIKRFGDRDPTSDTNVILRLRFVYVQDNKDFDSFTFSTRLTQTFIETLILEENDRDRKWEEKKNADLCI